MNPASRLDHMFMLENKILDDGSMVYCSYEKCIRETDKGGKGV
jgi:hypothetical protein